MKKFSFKTILIVFLLMAAFTTACNQASRKTPEQEESQPTVEQEEPGKEENSKGTGQRKLADYFPLTLGSTWQYSGEGSEYASFTREVVFAEGNRGQIKEDNGGTVSAAVFAATDQEITRIFFQGESYENENFLNAQTNDSLIILKAPLRVGTKWETTDSTREIVDVNASVDTPAGNFTKVIQVKITYPDSTIMEYFKDGVGMVKREFVSGDFKVTSILEKYEIKKP